MAEAQPTPGSPPHAIRTRTHTNPTTPTSPPPKRFKPSPPHPTSDSTMSKSAPYPPGLSLPLDDEASTPTTTTTSATNTNAAQSATLQDSVLHQTAAETIPLQIKKLRPEAIPPSRGSKYSAGYDIYVCEDVVVPKWGKAMLSTGIACAIPPGTYGRIAPRSGLAAKHSIATGAGVIDYDYRGEVKVLLFNHSGTDFAVNAGDRMAQLVLERIVNPEVVVVEELEGTERGVGGFGSTGGFGFVSAAGNGNGIVANGGLKEGAV